MVVLGMAGAVDNRAHGRVVADGVCSDAASAKAHVGFTRLRGFNPADM